jgi:hypothetical protein
MAALAESRGRKAEQNLGWLISNSDNLDTGSGKNTLRIVVGSLVFGSLHITVWNLVFPTSIEKILWRVARICCTPSLLVGLVTVK